MEITSYEELAERVEDRGNVLTLRMSVLRELHEAGRLGTNVVEGISKRLAQHGLGHVPDPLPRDQYQVARVFKRGTQIAAIITAAHNPGDDADDKLREVANSELADRVQRIREIICD